MQVWIYRWNEDGLREQEQVLEVLLLQTQPERGGFWQPVTGHVESGETPEQGAFREAREETGLAIEGELEKLGSFTFESRFVGWVEEFCYAIRAPGQGEGITLDAREHQAFRWVGAKRALGMLRYDSNVRMLETLLRSKARVTES
ncbi:MAG: NUDIX domain-containing protein [Oligoflexia bacterium]|nr:NUDIX domain-containing protein [Oligoflexia bacterium]